MAEEEVAAVGGDDGGEERPAKKVRTEEGERERKPDGEFKVGASAADDETTLDEEEFEQGGAASQAAESSALADEAEMPLEQLLAMYGLSKDQLEGDAPGLKDDDNEEVEDEEEEEEPVDVDVDEETATLTAKGWYDTLGPFAGMYEMVVSKAYKNSATEWSIRYTVTPVGDTKPLDHEFFVRFYYEREKTRKGYKYSVKKMSEDAASEA